MLAVGASADGSANPAESVTLEPDVYLTAGIAVFSKMQRTCHPLFIVESSPARTGPEVPSEEGRVRRDSKTTSGKEIRDGPGFRG